MAWNHPIDNPAKKGEGLPKRNWIPFFTIFVVLSILLLLALFAVFMLNRATSEAPVAIGNDKIKEAPQKIKTRLPKVVESKVIESEFTQKTNFVNGVWHDEFGRPHYKPERVIHLGSNTVINGVKWVPPRRIFTRISEIELDRVLASRPGDRIIGQPNWALFEDDLREAITEPIIIDSEDSEEESERKRAVHEAKQILAMAINNGESASDILKKARDEVNKLADLYDNLNKELSQLSRDETLTEQEIDDYVEAANTLLKSNQIFTKKFHTPRERREKAEAARLRKLLIQRND